MPKDYDIKWDGDNFMRAAIVVSVQQMETAATMVEKTVVDSFGTGASRRGVKHRRSKGKKGTYHRPSAPYFPPNIDTGDLKASIGHEVVGKWNVIDGFVGVGSMVKYGLFLELGTIKMKPRPFLRPALKNNHAKILHIFQKGMS